METKPIKVLLIEDNPGDARLMREILSEERNTEFDLMWVDRLAAGLDALAVGGIDIVLLDLTLPDSSGLDTFVRTHAIAPHVPIVVLSGLNDEEMAVRAVREGAQDYLVKGQVDTKLLVRAMQYAIERKRAGEDLRIQQEFLRNVIDADPNLIYVKDQDGRFTLVNQAVAELYGSISVDEVVGKSDADVNLNKNEVEHFQRDDREVTQSFREKRIPVERITDAQGNVRWLQTVKRPILSPDGKTHHVLGISADITERRLAEEKLKQSLEKLRKSMEGTIQAIAMTVELKDPYTAGHQRRVAELASAIAQEMNLTSDQIYGIQLAAGIHDIGKISIPAEILSKPGKISPIEFNLIKTHPQVGYEILKAVEFPWPIAQIVLQHHERIDGSGYPFGLIDQDIILETKIICVADVVEAMSSHRPYRPSLGMDMALQEISEKSGRIYDSLIVEICLKLFREKGFKFTFTETQFS
jgi:PAS domain S-box-containing protein